MAIFPKFNLRHFSNTFTIFTPLHDPPPYQTPLLKQVGSFFGLNFPKNRQKWHLEVVDPPIRPPFPPKLTHFLVKNPRKTVNNGSQRGSTPPSDPLFKQVDSFFGQNLPKNGQKWPSEGVDPPIQPPFLPKLTQIFAKISRKTRKNGSQRGSTPLPNPNFQPKMTHFLTKMPLFGEKKSKNDFFYFFIFLHSYFIFSDA